MASKLPLGTATNCDIITGMLNQDFINVVKLKLETELKRLNQEIAELQNEKREDLGMSATEDIDRASADASSLESESKISSLDKEKELVVLALKKIEEGKFGICEKCGQEIDKARLEIMPTAKLCMGCKIICDNCGLEIEEARILGKTPPLICQSCEEEAEPETYFTSSSIRAR